MRKRRLAHLLTAGLLCLGFGGCFSEDPDDPRFWFDYSDPDPAFSIGGRIQGSAGGLTLQNSNGTLLNVARDGSFSFDTHMVSGALYDVKVAVPPRTRTCRVANGSGIVGHHSITNVTITCE